MSSLYFLLRNHMKIDFKVILSKRKIIALSPRALILLQNKACTDKNYIISPTKDTLCYTLTDILYIHPKYIVIDGNNYKITKQRLNKLFPLYSYS